MTITDYQDLRHQHQALLNQLAEVVATGMKSRLRRDMADSELNELWVEINVRDSARGNIRILTADHDLGTAELRETDLLAPRAA